MNDYTQFAYEMQIIKNDKIKKINQMSYMEKHMIQLS